ncbi:hypothetical protein WMY93_009860 [Mugilogobius chulae]|uniref:LIM zinc-binding domain-containing protein n=1 Tax=Mugilogobius chulae TaxID=88201 RepID=A0AAW0P923_9GOBI
MKKTQPQAPRASALRTHSTLTRALTHRPRSAPSSERARAESHTRTRTRTQGPGPGPKTRGKTRSGTCGRTRTRSKTRRRSGYRTRSKTSKPGLRPSSRTPGTVDLCAALFTELDSDWDSDMGDMGDPPKKKRLVSLCVGCGNQIHDQYILRVSPDLEWHAACLKCAECSQYLDESCTCFVRDGKTYCKRDYIRLYGVKCAKCNIGFSKNDFVMRARAQVYHIECFRCVACSRQLIPGDEFALREDGLFCRADHDVVERATMGPGDPLSPLHPARPLQMAAEPVSARQPALRPHVHKQPEKTTRVRTVLNEKQLHTLRTCYNANPDRTL